MHSASESYLYFREVKLLKDLRSRVSNFEYVPPNKLIIMNEVVKYLLNLTLASIIYIIGPRCAQINVVKKGQRTSNMIP